MPTNFLSRFRTPAQRLSFIFSFIQHLIVLLACAASLLSSQLLLPSAALVLVTWLVRWWLAGRALAATPADLGILLLMGMAGLSLLITPLPELTQPQVLRLFIGIATYYALAEAVASGEPAQPNTAGTTPSISTSTSTSSSWVVFVLIGLALIGTLLAIIAPISVDWYANKGLIPARAYSQFIVLLSDSVHPNVMGGNLALFIPFALALILFFWQRLRTFTRIVTLGAAALMLLILLLTQSRSAYVAVVAAALCLCLLRLAMRYPKLVSAIGVLAFAGMGFVLAAFVFQLPLFSPANAPVTTQGVDTLNGRIEIWSRGIYMVQDFPFTGIGMGLHAKLIEAMYPYFINPVPLLHAHNLFLQIAVDLGLPGLVAWTAILIITLTCAISLYRSGRQANNLWRTGLGASLIASLLALIVGGLSDAVTWGGIRTAPLVWVIWGVAVGSWMHTTTQNKPHNGKRREDGREDD